MTLLESALQQFDEANLADPGQEPYQGQRVARAWLYGRRMSQMLAGFAPGSSEALQLAARAQHLKRWVIPRGDYPMGRVGYNAWRKAQGKFHADSAAEILSQCGYDMDTVGRVQALLQKKRLKQDAESQTLEDIACLVFLKYYLVPFAAKHPRDKLIDIIRKTWNKMSQQAHQAALALLPELPAEMQSLLSEALAER